MYLVTRRSATDGMQKRTDGSFDTERPIQGIPIAGRQSAGQNPVTTTAASNKYGVTIHEGRYYQYVDPSERQKVESRFASTQCQIQMIEPNHLHLLYEANLQQKCEHRRQRREEMEGYYFYASRDANSVERIIRNGFDRKYNPRDPMNKGDGVHFYEDASDALAGFPGGHLILARVCAADMYAHQRDVDILVKHILTEFQQKFQLTSVDKRAERRLRTAIERAKIKLFAESSASTHIGCDNLYQGKYRDYISTIWCKQKF